MYIVSEDAHPVEIDPSLPWLQLDECVFKFIELNGLCSDPLEEDEAEENAYTYTYADDYTYTDADACEQNSKVSTQIVVTIPGLDQCQPGTRYVTKQEADSVAAGVVCEGCEGCVRCPQGKYSVRSGTVYAECKTCPKAHYCEEGVSSPEPCPIGFYGQ